MQPLPGSILRRWQLDVVGPVTPASSVGARYLFHAPQPDSELEWGAAIRAKDDSTTAARVHHATFNARGLAPLFYESDLGGEFRGDAWDATMTDLGVHHEARAPEAHVDGVELAHRHSFRVARATSRVANAPAHLWDWSVIGAIDKRNIRAHDRGPPHVRLFREFPDLSAVMPFFSHVAARNNSGSLARMDDRAVVGRYLGAARGCGVGAIHVLVDRHPRVVRSFKYLAPPNAEHDTRALAPFGPARPPPTPTPAPTPTPFPTMLPTTLPTMLPTTLPTPLPTPQPSPYVSTATSGDVAIKVLQDNPKRPGTASHSRHEP